MALTETQRGTFYLVNRAVSDDIAFTGAVCEAALALHMSHDGLRGKLYVALRAGLELTEDSKWWESDLYIRDTFDGNVVYHHQGKEWRWAYSMVGDQPVLQGRPVVVELSYLDIASESATCKEARAFEVQHFALAKESGGEGEDGLIRVIAPGHGSSGYYPKEVLKRDGPKVFKKGTQMFWNHATEDMDEAYPVGDLNRQAGVLTSDAFWDENGPVGPGVYAHYHAFEDYKPKVAERAKYNAVQISWKGIYGYTEGQVAGSATRIVQSLKAAESVDFVTLAGAGGAIARASESAASRRKENNVALVQVEDTELNQLRANAAKATEAETRYATAASALEAARKSAATAIINQVFGTKVIPDAAKESWRNVCMGAVQSFTKDEVLDGAAFENHVKTLVAPMPDVKAAEAGTGSGTPASEAAAMVNLGGGGSMKEDLSPEQAFQRAKEMYIRRGYKPETAEMMARG